LQLQNQATDAAEEWSSRPSYFKNVYTLLLLLGLLIHVQCQYEANELLGDVGWRGRRGCCNQTQELAPVRQLNDRHDLLGSHVLKEALYTDKEHSESVQHHVLHQPMVVMCMVLPT